MKLIRCHIENFGGLSGYDLEFDPGLTVLQEENGFGKTTLAEFIRAMFYSLPSQGAARATGRRKKYRPWNGGKYGGNLVFEHEGKCYRVERTFGATPKADTFKLMDLDAGMESFAFSAALGDEIFGLDASSFERSTYLPQIRTTGPLATDSIQAKLGGLVEDDNDVGGFEKAMKKLENKRKTYIPYKNQEHSGTVAEARRQILALQLELDRAEESARSLTAAEAEMTAMEQQLTQLESQIRVTRVELTGANEAAARLAHRRQLAGMEEEYRNAAATLTALEKKYPKGIPGEEALAALTDAVEMLARLGDAPVTAADEEARRYVEENRDRFGDGSPTETQITGMRQICDDYSRLSLQRDACALSPADAEELETIRAFLAPGVPGESVLDGFEGDWEEAQRLRRENLRLAGSSAGAAAVKPARSPLIPLLMALGGAAVVAGIVLFILNMTAPGGIGLGLGLVALVVAGNLSMRATMARQVPVMDPGLQAIIRENESRAAELEARVQTFTRTYREGPAAETLHRLRDQLARLHALEQRQQDLARRHQELERELESSGTELRRFFARYFPRGYSGSGYDLLARLQRESDAWERAVAQLADRDRRLEHHREESRRVHQVLGQAREGYGLMLKSRDQVLALRDDARLWNEQKKAARQLQNQMEQFRREHAHTLTGPDPGEGADLPTLRDRERRLLEEQQECSRRLLALGQRQQELSRLAQQIPEIRDSLERWETQRDRDTARAGLLDDTMAFLEQARTDLALAYMIPIRDSFGKLMERMAGQRPGEILVTPELTVQLDRGGESRKLAEYFSAGETDLVMLCMRLALVDAMFRDAKPFVILDDPFVNLDDRHTAEAMKLIRELARDRQIIYLTCHSSRT